MTERTVVSGGAFLISDTRPEDVFIPEEMTKAHQMICQAAVDFVKKEILPNVERIEEKDEAFVKNLLKMAGELGLNGTEVPEAYGGEGLDKVSTCLVSEAMGGAPSFVVSHSAHTGIGTLPIVYFGNEAQKKKYLPRLAEGECFAAYCLTEPGAGSDALNSQSIATLSEDGRHYLLNGEKIYITNGAWAEVFVVYAKVDGEAFTGFIVERAFPGVSNGAEEHKMGIKGSSTTSVILKDCPVPVENVLFEVGKGHKIAFNILNIGRYKLGAGCIGGCKLAIAEAAKHATTREQFGKKIAEFGMIKNKFADMAVKTYMTESIVYRMAAALDDKFESLDAEVKRQPSENAKAIEEYAIECSIAKVFGSESLDFCVDEMVQIFGGAGFIADYPAERLYRDARINRIFEGTNEINRLLIPGTLVKRAFQNRLPLMEALQKLTEELKTLEVGVGEEKDGALASQKHLLKMSKKITLLAAGSAVGKLLADLENQQEVLAILADMIMEIYVMDSGLVRAQKYADMKGEKKAAYHIAAVQIYIADVFPKIVQWGKQVLAYVETGEDLAKQLSVLDKLGKQDPIDTITLRRQIAERVIKAKKYPL